MHIHRRDVAARRLFVAAVELRGGGRRYRLFARQTTTRLHFQTQRQQSLVEVCVTFGTARRGLGRAAAHTGPSSLYQM